MTLKTISASLVILTIGTANAAYHPGSLGHTANAASNAKVAKLQAELDRNQNPYYGETDWFNRITLSGLVQAYGVIENQDHATPTVPVRFPQSGTTFSSDIFLSRANIYVDADVNKWTTTHIALNANQIFGGQASDSYGALFDANTTFNTFGTMDEATVIFGNFDESPAYARIGRFYTRYGWYKRNVIPATLTQILTETQVNGLEVGFAAANGFNGSAAAFRGLRKNQSGRTTVNNFAVQFGYDLNRSAWGGTASLDFMYNIADVNAITQSMIGNTGQEYYSKAVPGLALSGKAYYEQFDFVGTYTTALTKFSPSELPYASLTRGALPSAFTVGLGYRFPMAGYDSRLGISYQMSFQTSGANGANNGIFTGLPEYRVEGDYNVTLWKNTELQFTMHWDRDTSTPEGTGRSILAGLLGVSAKFA